jgi:hypothetical protein
MKCPESSSVFAHSPEQQVRFCTVILDEALADASHAFPSTADWQGRHFVQANRNGVTIISCHVMFLERRQRDRYSPKIINEMTGDVTLGYGEIESAPKALSSEEARKMTDENR